jgi:hypothetical protein
MHDASLPSTTTYSSAGGNPTTIEILNKEEIVLDSYLGGTEWELCARLSKHVLIWPNLMREGIKGYKDVNRTPSSSWFLLEQILCYQRGFFPTVEDQRWEYTSKDMSHHNGRWGHWGHQQLHGYSQTHVLFKREWLQTKPCLTPIVVRDRNPAETQRLLGSAHTRNEAE